MAFPFPTVGIYDFYRRSLKSDKLKQNMSLIIFQSQKEKEILLCDIMLHCAAKLAFGLSKTITNKTPDVNVSVL